jgi:hypothetical protein
MTSFGIRKPRLNCFRTVLSDGAFSLFKPRLFLLVASFRVGGRGSSACRWSGSARSRSHTFYRGDSNWSHNFFSHDVNSRDRLLTAREDFDACGDFQVGNVQAFANAEAGNIRRDEIGNRRRKDFDLEVTDDGLQETTVSQADRLAFKADFNANAPPCSRRLLCRRHDQADPRSR